MAVGRLGTLALASAALLLGSCETNNASIYIAAVIPIDTTTCTFATGSTVATGGTYVDASAGGPVVIGVEVHNLIRQRNYNIATDTSTVIVDQADISISGASGGGTVNVAAGAIPGSIDGIHPGVGVVSIPILDAGAIGSVAAPATIVVSITLHGHTLGGIDVEGGPFNWVVTVQTAGSRSVYCDPGTGVDCCAGGQNNEFLCLVNDIGKCAPQ